MYHQHRFSALDTPYTDELVFGFDQNLLGGNLSSKWVSRFSQAEFARSYGDLQPDGLRYYQMSNAGESRHDSLRISWERQWFRQHLLVSWTWQQSSTSNESYNVVLDEDAAEQRVWLGDEIIYSSELPRQDYNRPQVVKLFYQLQIGENVRFTNFTRYLGTYQALEKSGEERPVPTARQRTDLFTGDLIEESLPVYRQVTRGNELIFDWKLSWYHTIFRKQDLLLELDILNLLDRRIETTADSGNYKLGRQFWVGLEMQF